MLENADLQDEQDSAEEDEKDDKASAPRFRQVRSLLTELYRAFPEGKSRRELLREMCRHMAKADREYIYKLCARRGPYRGSSDRGLSKSTHMERFPFA